MRHSGTEQIECLTDQEIVSAILAKDATVTRLYLYELCYPLFKARYDKYYTDCASCIEFINAIYIYIMTPGPKTGKCYMETFGFSCRLMHWLKIVSENYCRQLFQKKLEFSDSEEATDRNMGDSISLDMKAVNTTDIRTVLALMPNKRYSSLIHYRYVEDRTNEETAKILGMSMDNYYNKHKLAKAQFVTILKKEGLI